MAENNQLEAELRTQFGKGAARKIRAAHKIPAVIYGHGTDPQHVTLPGHETSLLVRRANALLDVQIEGKKQLTLVKDIQRDPVRQVIEHIDLVVVRRGEKVRVEVPVHLEGQSAPGTIATLDVTTIALEVEATHIPENVVVSIEGAENGTQIHARDVTLPEGSTLADDPDLFLVGISLPAVADLGEPAAEEGEAEEESGEAAKTEPEE